ncbi:hypothetical protein LCGC14_0235280 [marine sediment metagenome]|uniref:Uncharacterized protein n=1 Tax=marine sediment metagenome TaxID=412755 RepID=A0A0F9UQ78_9ZZZZ
MKHWDRLELATQNKVWDILRQSPDASVDRFSTHSLEHLIDDLIDVLFDDDRLVEEMKQLYETRKGIQI